MPDFRLDETRSAPDNEVAILKNRWGCPFCVKAIWKDDGTLLFDYEENFEHYEAFYLPPGQYEILYGSYGYAHDLFSRQDKVELETGKRYRIKAKHPYFERDLAYLWVEEESSGRIVAGQPPE